MKAMILAAGLGTRLGEITKTKPKCLVEVGGKSMIEHTLDALLRAGIKDVVINLFHLGEQVREYCSSLSCPGLTLHFSPENKLLGTGGGLLHAKDFFGEDEDVIVHNADIYSSIDLGEMFRMHREKKSLATLAVMSRPSRRTLFFDARNNLSGWRTDQRQEVDAGGDLREYAFCGVQVVSMRLLKWLREETPPFSIITSYMKAAAEGEKVEAFPVDGSFWIDVGTPEKLEELRALVTARRV